MGRRCVSLLTRLSVRFIASDENGEIQPTRILNVSTEESYDLYAFGCPNLKATVERLRMVAALAPVPVAKKLFYMLSVKLSAEGVERWYRCFYCKLRVLKNHREGCYDETDED